MHELKNKKLFFKNQTGYTPTQYRKTNEKFTID